MPFIPTANTAKVAVRGSFLGETIVNTLWFTFTQGIIASMLDDLNTAVETWFKTYVLTQLSNNYTLTDITATDQSAANGISRTKLVTSGNTGAISTGSNYPGNVALVVTNLTGFRGRSFRGRTYFGGFRDASIGSDGNSVLASVAASLAAAIVPNLVNAVLSVTGTPVPSVVSHYANKQPRVSGYSNPIQAATANVAWDSQRRRLKGRGK